MDKIKVISKKKIGENELMYHIEEHCGITHMRFTKEIRWGWVLDGSNYCWDRPLILFIESVLRGLNS